MTTLALRYIGPFDAVEVDLGARLSRPVAHGADLEVDDRDLAASLLIQDTNWEPANDAALDVVRDLAALEAHATLAAALASDAVAELDDLEPTLTAGLVANGTKAELVAALEAEGLPTDGTKAELADRLTAHLLTTDPPPEQS